MSTDSQYRYNHSPKGRAAQHRYAAKNREKRNAYNREWRKQNRELVNAKQRERRAARKGHAKLATAKQILIVCVVCGREFVRHKPEQVCCSRACGASRAIQTRRAARPRTEGKTQGVASMGVALPPKKVMERIEWLAALDRRRKRAQEEGDWKELERIAREYAAGDREHHIRPLPELSGRVTREARQAAQSA